MADTGRTVFADDFFADGFWAVGFWAADEPVEVPNVVGETQAAGTATLEGAGFVVVVATAYSSVVPAGTIISQVPASGEFAAPGSTVTITVSLGDAPAQDTQASGGYGWWPDYEQIRRERERRRREIEEAEAETQRLQDETDREIARLLREQEAAEAERADLQRLQRLADKYAGESLQELPKPARVAILNAQDARTRNSLEQMRRVIEQTLLDEEMAVMLLLLADD